MTGSTFEASRFEGVQLSEGDWSFVNFRHVALQKMDWTGVRLTETDFYSADLTETIWDRADLTRAVLQHAICRDADFSGASTDGVDWSGVDVTRTTLDVTQAIQFARSHGAVIR